MKKIYTIFFTLLLFQFFFEDLKAKTTSIQKQKTLISSNLIQVKNKCSDLVNKLGGINSVSLLWLDKSDQEEAYYALINTFKNNEYEKIFYLCVQKEQTFSNDAEEALIKFELQKIFTNPKNMMKHIFSLISDKSLRYILTKLTLSDYNLTRPELILAFTEYKSEKIEKTNIAKSQSKEKEKLEKEKKELKIAKKKLAAEKKALEKMKKDKSDKNKKIAKKSKSGDKEGAIIDIPDKIIVKQNQYVVSGKIYDKGSKKVHLKVKDDFAENPIDINDKGEFSISGYTLESEKLKLIAIDGWGNTTTKIVSIDLKVEKKVVVEKIDKLNPSLIKKRNNPNRVAIIIGIENYASSPKATFAKRDAQYFAEYVKNGFGVSDKNIKILVDKEATLIQSFKIVSKWLPGKIKPNITEIIIFFAGHGLATPNGKDLYLLAYDSDPDLLERTALQRTDFFTEIDKLKPKKVTMFLDTCYSGSSRDDETLLVAARPIKIVSKDEANIPKNFTLFSASGMDQISSGFKKAKHGMFSYYLMKGLEGKADSNKDKKITNGELLVYIDENVSHKAAELGRQQNPSLAGDPDEILMSYR